MPKPSPTKKPSKKPRKAADTSTDAAVELQKDAVVLRLRLAGLTLAEIGAALVPPVTKQAVGQRLQRILGEQAEENASQASHLKGIQNARIETLIRGLWAEGVKGKVAVVDRIERLLRRQAELWGLDAPKKIAETDASGADLPVSAKTRLRARLLEGAPDVEP